MSISYVLINCENGAENSVMNELEKIDSVKEIARVIGSFDVVVKLEDSSPRDLRNATSSQIRTIDKIRSTLTLPIIESQE